MAKMNLGRVRYPIEATVKPGSCWPVSSNAVYACTEALREQILDAVEKMGPTVSSNGWYISYIDDSKWNYVDGTGLVDIYVDTEQATLSRLAGDRVIESVYDPSFETGWGTHVGGPYTLGDFVTVRNVNTFTDCGILKAVSGNRITIQGVGVKFLNHGYVDGLPQRIKAFFTSEYASMKTPGEIDKNLAGEWTVTLSRPQSVVNGAASIASIGEIKCAIPVISSGIDSIALGHQSTVLGEHSIANGNNASAIGTGIYNPMANSVVVGRWNAIPAAGVNYPFAVGIGTSASDRRDGFRVNANGSVYIAGITGITPPKRTDTLSQVAAKVRALTSILCSNPDGTSAIEGGAIAGGDGDYPACEFTPALGEGDEINMLAYSKTKNVLVAATDIGLFYSTDGKKFQIAAGTEGSIWTDVVWDPFHTAGEGTFIASSNAGIRYSVDGAAWSVAKVTTKAGEIVDATSPADPLRIQVSSNPYAFCGGRVSTDGGRTWTYAGGADNAAVFWKELSPTNIQHIEIVSGTGGRITMYDSTHGTSSYCHGVEHGYTSMIAMDNIGIGATAAKNLIFAISLDPLVPVKYTMVGDGDGTEWKECNAPKDAYIGGRIYDVGHGHHHVVLVTRSNGVYATEEFKGSATVWKHVPNMSADMYHVPSLTNNCVGINVFFDTARGVKDALMVSAGGTTWSRVQNFTIDAQPPVSCFDCQFAFIANHDKEIIIVPVEDLKADILDAAARSERDSLADSSRYVKEVDPNTEGLSAVVDQLNYVAAKLNIVIDKLNI